jgi:CO/xanthine dehydrogenase Mo-binding subunit
MVYTNTVPCGHMRAPGGAQPGHAIECHMDLCARAMGMDPLELRLANAASERGMGSGERFSQYSPQVSGHGPQPLTSNLQPPTSNPQSPTRAREALRAAAEAIGWDQPKPEGVGRGIALADVMNSPATAYTARMVLQRDGRIVFQTPIIEQGSGMLTAFQLLTAEALGVSPDLVQVHQTMEGIDYDRGVGGSRITRIVGKMIGMQAEALQKRLAQLVAAEFGHDPAQVAIQTGGFRTPDGKHYTLAEAASLASENLEELLCYEVEPDDVVETYGAVAAEVRVDVESGQATVQRIAIALERGKIVNPVMYQGQIDGGLVQGLGYALTEGLVFDEGRVTNLNLHEYKLPVTADIPELETILLEPDLSLGITPIGEGPNCGISAAIANAVMDVIHRQVEIPIASETLV